MARARLLSCVGKCVTCKETFNYDVLIDVDEWEVQQFCSQTCWDMYHLNEEEVGGVSIEDYKVDEVKRTKE
jgi:hypothetical protein